MGLLPRVSNVLATLGYGGPMNGVGADARRVRPDTQDYQEKGEYVGTSVLWNHWTDRNAGHSALFGLTLISRRPQQLS
jgi:hypothetical protein